MKMLVGLGNPDKEYQLNRHNAGFLFVDAVVDEWQFSKKINSDIGSLIWGGEKAIALKPRTFVNKSGEAVISCANYFKINVGDIYVAHDDLDMSLGTWKVQQSIGPKVHNGIVSIEESLRSKDFWRIRIGVDARKEVADITGKEYVLSDFSENELKLLRTSVFIAIRTKLGLFL